ncbi:MAG: hypothetical protein KC464_02060 [Myxococcales bacterium]|nr:hypothetical protein [Myxococcales bacterium]
MAAGTKQSMAIGFEITMDSAMGSMAMPAMTMNADVEVLQAGDAGATYQTTFTGMDVKDVPGGMPGLSDMMKKSTSAIAGLKLTATVDPSGKISDFKFDASAVPAQMQQVVDQTKQSIEQMVAQLPTEAVGKGAKWQTKQTIDQNGMKIDQTMVFELVDATATTAHVRAISTMSAGKQTIKTQGMTATLESLTGNGDMDMQIDLTKPVPAVTGTVDTKTKLSAMGQTIDMSVAVKMSISAK